MSLKSIGTLSTILNSIANESQLSATSLASMTASLKGMSEAQIAATVSASGLSAAQIASTLSASGMNEAMILENLALMGFSKEASIAAVVSDNFSREEAEAAAAGYTFAAAQGTAAASTGGLSTAIAGLSAVMATNPILAIVTAVSVLIAILPAAIKLFDSLIVTAEEANEKMDESFSEFEDATNKVESLNDELENTRDRIEELEAKDSLTFVEESELEKLRESVELLQIQADLAEKDRVRAAKESADDTVTAFRKNYKNDMTQEQVDEYVATAQSTGNNAILSSDERNVASMLAFIEQMRDLRDECEKSTDDYLHFQEQIDWATDSLWEQANVLNTYKSNLEAIPYDELSDEQKQALEEINAAIQLIYQSLDPSKWNEIQWNKITNSDEYKDEIKELNELAAEGKITADTIRNSFPDLAQACEDAGLELEDVAENLNGLNEVEDSGSAATERYTAQLSDLQDVLSDLKDSYDVIADAEAEMASGGGLSNDTISALADIDDNYLDYLYEENGLVKLNTEAWKENADAKMQSEMAEIQKEIDSIEAENEALEELIKTYEEKRLAALEEQDLTSYYDYYHEIDNLNAKIQENNALIEQNQGKLAVYSALYGSITGDLDAYTAALNNFQNIASTIDSVSNSFQTLADLQAQVANGFTMSLDKALEFASVYPEILNSAQVASDGQITLNEGVVNSFIEGKKAELDAQIDSQINQLESDKAVLTAKMEMAQAQLDLAESVANGEGEISKQLAEYRINAGNAVAQALIDAGVDEATAFQLAAAAMSQNVEEFNRIAAEVCTDVDGNFNQAAYDMAQTMFNNLTNVKTDLASVARQAHETAEAIAGVASGTVAGSSSVQGGSGGGTGGSGINITLKNGTFKGTEFTYEAKQSSLDDFIADLKVDIASYQNAISQIDGQIAALQALKNIPLKSFKSSGSGSGSGGSGGGSGSGSSAAKEVEEYTASIEDYREALERLSRVQIRQDDLETQLSNTKDLKQQIDLQKQLVDVYRDEQDALHNLNDLRDETITNGVASLQSLGFNIEYDRDNNKFFVQNLEHINELVADSKGKYGSLQEATNALRKETEDMINTLEELNEQNQEGSKTWKELQYAIQEATIAIFDNTVKERENANTIAEGMLNHAISENDHGGVYKYADEMVANYRKMQDAVHEESEYYRSLGYSDTSDEITQLKSLWWEYYDAIKNTVADAFQQIVDNASESVDVITGVYDTLKTAAQEFDESGFITIKTLQDICNLGVQYLAYLKDENGQLVINEQNIQNVIAARTQQLAIESALNYISQIRTALNNDDIVSLNNLIFATQAATESTWDLVYAQLRLLGLNGEQYNAALTNINNLRSLADITVSGIGKSEGAIREANEAAKEALEDQSDALSDLLKYVEEMIKQEVQNQIDAIEQQIDDFKEIIDLQKESLKLEKEKDEYTKKVADKTKEMAELQKQLYLLDLDDSRDAQAKKAKLQEQLAELQEDLADEQSDHAYDATVDMLDEVEESYEKEKQKEIDILEESISSEEKLYRLALQRIEEQGQNLINQLLEWNTEYGTVTNDTILECWENASAAVQRYGSYLEAVLATQREIAALEASSSSYSSGGGISSPNILGNTGSYDTSGGDAMIKNVSDIVQQMREWGKKWSATNDQNKRAQYHEEAVKLANKLPQYGVTAQFEGSSGIWYIIKDRLNPNNVGKILQNCYHSGGYVGDSSLKQDEEWAKLQKGELVVTEKQQEPMFKALDFTETMLGKYGKILGAISGTDMLSQKMASEIKRDGQDAQNAVENMNIVFNNTVNIPVQTLQKLDDSEIKQLTKKIGDSTIDRINDSFYKRGKVKNRMLLKPRQ